MAGIIAGNHETGEPLCGPVGINILYPNKVLPELFIKDGGFIQGDPIYTSICNLEATVVNYEDMVSFGTAGNVTNDPLLAAVNESYGCLHEQINCTYSWAADREGLVQDFFSRYYDMVVVKGAGNNNTDRCEFHTGGADQEACPFSLNSICVGGGQV